MTFDKVTPLNRRTNGKFRDYPNNMNYPRPNQAYEPPWIRSQRWMATTPAAIGRGSNERDGYSRLTKISIFYFLTLCISRIFSDKCAFPSLSSLHPFHNELLI